MAIELSRAYEPICAMARAWVDGDSQYKDKSEAVRQAKAEELVSKELHRYIGRFFHNNHVQGARALIRMEAARHRQRYMKTPVDKLAAAAISQEEFLFPDYYEIDLRIKGIERELARYLQEFALGRRDHQAQLAKALAWLEQVPLEFPDRAEVAQEALSRLGKSAADASDN